MTSLKSIEMKWYRILDLKNDPKLIQEYEFWHKPENIWKEIPRGIREVGITEMEIYRWANRLLMVIDVPDDFDLKRAMDQLQKLPFQNEWEELMNTFQQVSDDLEDISKWKLMKKIFSLSACNSLEVSK
jgi:L-rhamnose mutarotase